MPLLLALAALAAAVALMNNDKNDAPAGSPLPSDPAGRRARARSAIVNTSTAPIPWDWLYYQAQVETGDFKLVNDKGGPSNYVLTNSLFNRHVGSGRGEWTGRVVVQGVVYPSEAAALKVDPRVQYEHLRVYDSPEQSVRDIMQLYNDPLYKGAMLAAKAGNRAAFFQALADGNGETGFVGDPKAKKAKDYVVALNDRAARAVIA